MHTRTRRTAALAAAGLLLLAGCRTDGAAREPAGGDLRQSAGDRQPASATQAPVAVDVCELLTAAEVEDAFGRPVTVEPVNEMYCNYVIEGDDGLGTDLTVSLISPAGVTADLFPSVVAAGVGNDLETEQLDGPGDAALLSTRGEITIVNVLEGEAWLTLNVLAPDGSDRSAEALTQLAELAVGRLA